MRVCLMAFSFCPLCIHLNFFFSLNTKALSLLRTVGLSSGASLKNTLKLLPLWTRLKFEILLVSLNVHVALQARDLFHSLPVNLLLDLIFLLPKDLNRVLVVGTI